MRSPIKHINVQGFKNECSCRKYFVNSNSPSQPAETKFTLIDLTSFPNLKLPIIPYSNPAVNVPAAEDAHPPAFGPDETRYCKRPNITRSIANGATQLFT